MREILFRGKRIDNGEWVYGNITQYHYDICSKDDIRYGEKDRYFMSSVEINDNAMVGFDGLEVIPETVGQYTGRCDKNGTKIFEGDIIKVSIYYDVGCYPHSESKIITVEIPSFYNLDIDGDIEVIGNIHDNPELLKNG